MKNPSYDRAQTGIEDGLKRAANPYDLDDLILGPLSAITHFPAEAWNRPTGVHVQMLIDTYRSDGFLRAAEFDLATGVMRGLYAPIALIDAVHSLTEKVRSLLI